MASSGDGINSSGQPSTASAHRQPSVDSTAPITFEDLGIKRQPVVRESWLGKIRSVESIKRKEWVFWSISHISILTCIGVTIQRLTILPKDSEDLTLAIVLLFNCAVSVWYILHGTLFERPYEIAVFVCATIVVACYCIIEYIVVTDRRDTVKLVRLVIVCTLAPPSIILGCMIARQFYVSANLIFRTVGAMQELQSACWMLFLFEDLLKFDFQLTITMVIMILKQGNAVSYIESWVIGIGVPYAVLWLLLGFSLVRCESKLVAVTFMITGLAQPAYNIYKIYDSAQRLQSAHIQFNLPTFVFAGGTFALCLRLFLMLLLVFKVMRNFGRGLGEKVYGEQACCVDVPSKPADAADRRDQTVTA